MSPDEGGRVRGRIWIFVEERSLLKSDNDTLTDHLFLMSVSPPNKLAFTTGWLSVAVIMG